jgi:hypothetical protein
MGLLERFWINSKFQKALRTSNLAVPQRLKKTRENATTVQKNEQEKISVKTGIGKKIASTKSLQALTSTTTSYTYDKNSHGEICKWFMKILKEN